MAMKVTLSGMPPGTDRSEVENKRREEQRERRRKQRIHFRTAVSLTILITLGFVAYGYTTNYIPSESMEPTLTPGDHILTMRSWLAYPMGQMPQRGDVIIFRLPGSKVAVLEGGSSPAQASEKSKDASDKSASQPEAEILIKRVVGLPGDTVQFIGGELYLNGKKQQEPYASNLPDPSVDYPYASHAPLKVPARQLFVLGDNRDNSADGRYWGTLEQKNVLGRFVRILYNEGKHGINTLRDDG